MTYSAEQPGTTKYDTFYRAARNTENKKGIKWLKGNELSQESVWKCLIGIKD